MMRHNILEWLLIGVTLLILTYGLTSCCLFKPDNQVILQGNSVQKMLKGESANFDGYLLGNEALARLLEKAEK